MDVHQYRATWARRRKSPIASLPHIEPDEYPYIVEQDPLEPREALPVYESGAQAESASTQQVQEQPC